MPNNIIYMSIGINTRPSDEFSLAVETISGNGQLNFHRVLRLTIAMDGSLYLTMMKIGGEDKEWYVSSAPFDKVALTRKFDSTKMNKLGKVSTPKFSFHATGAINVGNFRIYRPPLRTLEHLEQLCLLQYGNPVNLPVISTEEFNSWKEKKGHPLLPLGVPVLGGILATRIFASSPNGFDTKKDLVCSDFELFQQYFIFQIRGLSDVFPISVSGEHGYDLLIATGLWRGESWKGPSIIVPATHPLEDPESSRKKS